MVLKVPVLYNPHLQNYNSHTTRCLFNANQTLQDNFPNNNNSSRGKLHLLLPTVVFPILINSNSNLLINLNMVLRQYQYRISVVSPLDQAMHLL